MNSKRMLVPIGALLVVALIIVGGFLVFSDKSKNSGDSGNSGNEMDGTSSISIMSFGESEKPAELYATSTFGELKRVSDPKFKVGDKYSYHRVESLPGRENLIFLPEEYDTVVEVKEKNRINKSNYYALDSKNVSLPPPQILKKDEQGIWQKKTGGVVYSAYLTKDENGTEKGIISQSNTHVYEGCMKSVNEENGEILEMTGTRQCPVLYEMYALWMLYLDKGVSWVEQITTIDPVDRHQINFEEEWRVTDIEKLNGKECFKVVVTSKTEISGIEGKKISGEVITYWVDAEKRILVKMERKEDNILTETIELNNYET